MKSFMTQKTYLAGVFILTAFSILPGCSGGEAGGGHWNAPVTTPAAVSALPIVTNTVPANAATGVLITTKNIAVTFNKVMDQPTIVITVQASGVPLGPILAGNVAYNSLTNKATFSPDVDLAPDTEYTVTVTNATKDMSGNALVVPATGLLKPNPWKFRTAAIGSVLFPVVDLGFAATYGIAATAGVKNTITAPITHINGDVILDPNQTCNDVTVDNAGGFGLCNGMSPTIDGTVITNTYPDTLTSASVKADLNAAYLSITPPAGPPAVGSLGGGTPIAAPTTLGALTGSAQVLGDNYFTPGTYISGTSILISDDIELNGLGDPNAVFVFQSASTLTTADGAATPGAHTRILLTGGTKASNVWWQVGSSATIGTQSEFYGNILAAFDITMKTGAKTCGRSMAGAWVGGAGAFVFDSNIVTVPGHPSALPDCQ